MKRPHTLAESLPGLRRMALYFWPFTRGRRVLLAGSVLALILKVGLQSLEPWPLKFVFDRVLRIRHHARIPVMRTRLDGFDPATLIMIGALAIIVITALRGLVEYMSEVGFARLANRVLAEVRSTVFRRLQALSLSYHSRARSGDLIVRLIHDISTFSQVLITAALPLVSELLVTVCLIGIMFYLHWRLTALALAILPVLYIFISHFTRRVQQSARSCRQREAAMAATAAEAIGAIRLVQALGLEETFARSFEQENEASEAEELGTRRLTAALGRSAACLMALSVALVLWYGARLVLRGELTPGELLVFITYLRSVFRPMQGFGKYTARIAKATAGCERIIDLLERIPEVHDRPNALPAPRFRGAIRLEGLGFAYDSGRAVLEDIDLAIAPGQHVALVGPSGIGKSTLVSLLIRLYDPVGGRILIDGEDIRNYTLASLRRQFSIVLQDTHLFAATVRDTIGHGMAEASDQDIEEAARLANAHDFIMRLPNGYDTILGERGVTLSGGERQRLAIARAAVRRASILILDEPTTGLDEANERVVLAALERLTRHRTTLLITHDLRLAAASDLIVYLDHGRIMESGTHQELMQHRGRYASLYRQQQIRMEHAPFQLAT
jgi:ATP-binding cassette subfamily B protein